MRTEEPVSTEPRPPAKTRREDGAGGGRRDSVSVARTEARHTEGRMEPDEHTPEEQGYGYGV